MKHTIAALIILLSACNSQKGKNTITETIDTASSQTMEVQAPTEVVWQGTLNNKIPVLLHYSIHDGDIAGEMIYLNTAAKKPISVCGNIKDDGSYDLYEYEKNGNVTGTIACTATGGKLTGSWYAGRSGKEYKLNLSKKDTVIATSLYGADISGNYRYQYGEDGYQGDFEIKKIGTNKFAFGISSVTGEPGRNLAEVSTDTIEMTGNSFAYKIPETTDCEFRVTFYRTFLKVDYTKGPCQDSPFGFNATVEGIYFKLPK
jgi:hypothetical protein